MSKTATICIERKRLSELEAHPRNPRRHPDPGTSEWQSLALSLEHDYFDPIVWNRRNGLLVSGHLRVKVLLDLGYEEADVSVVDYDEETHLARLLAANKLQGQDDRGSLIDVLEELQSGGLDLGIAGYTEGEIEELLGMRNEPEVQEDGFDADAEVAAIEEPVTKPGDLYILGKHLLLCGDATDPEDYARLMQGQLARLIFTDPPYNVNYRSPAGLDYDSEKYGGTGGQIFNDNLSDDDCLQFYSRVLWNMYEHSTDDVTIYWWFANKNNSLNRQAWENSRWYMSQIIIWLKENMIFSRGQDYHRMYEPCMVGWKDGHKHYRSSTIRNLKDVFNLDYPSFVEQFEELFDVWYQHRDNTAQYIHPTQKPVRLAERALRKNSEKGDIVLDAFGGSGSTLMACEQMGRSCYTIELDPKYCDAIVKRWEQFTGKKAVIESDVPCGPAS
jgi:DNA modification methylase